VNIESIRLVYFSPTGTTRKIVETIASGVGGAPFDRVDITLQSGRRSSIQTSAVQLLIVGVPVYAGRVPSHACQWLRTIQAHDTPAVCVVVYGNREYDDALLELKEAMVGVGCIPVALAAYVGEHSFSSAEIPIASGRPDAGDLKHAEAFGKQIKDTLLLLDSASQAHEIPVPGHGPFVEMDVAKVNLSPVEFIAVSDICSHCGVCAQVCPVGAIDPETSESIATKTCTYCSACVKKCPVGARIIKPERVKNIARRLSQLPRKQPVTFF